MPHQPTKRPNLDIYQPRTPRPRTVVPPRYTNSSQQFNPTPRFSTQRDKDDPVVDSSPRFSPLADRTRAHLPKPIYKDRGRGEGDSIDSASSSTGFEDADGAQDLPTVRAHGISDDEEGDEEGYAQAEAPSPSRRPTKRQRQFYTPLGNRLSAYDNEDLIPSSSPPIPDQTPLAHPAAQDESPDQSPTSPSLSHQRRPPSAVQSRFILPPATAAQPESLGAIPSLNSASDFSPPHKGNRFVPCGLASEVREWIIHVSTASFASTSLDLSASAKYGKGARGLGTSPYAIQVEVVGLRVLGDTGWFIRGRRRTADTSGQANAPSEDDRAEEVQEEVNVILAGAGAGRGAAAVHGCKKPEAGTVVGIQPPMWKGSVLEDECWVGVEWDVLAETTGGDDADAADV